MNNIFKPWYFVDKYLQEIEYTINPVEIAQHTIIIPGIKQDSIYDPYWKFHRLEFRCKHSRKIVKITDSIVTPEMIVLYVNKDARKYPYNKCVLISKLDYSDLITNIYVKLKR
jgi:hypothetical protein